MVTPIVSHPQIQEVVPINSYDAAGTFLLLGCNNGSIYYVGERRRRGCHRPSRRHRRRRHLSPPCARVSPPQTSRSSPSA